MPASDLFYRIPESLRHRKAAFAVLELFLSLLVITILVAYRGKGTVKTGSAAPNEQSYELLFQYPLKNATGHVLTSTGTVQQTETIEFSPDLSRSTEFLLAAAIITVLIPVLRIILYIVTGESPRSQVIPPVEIGVTAITAMALFVAASIFLWQVNTTLPSGVDLKLMEVFVIFCGIVWTINIWYAYRNTYLHRPYYVNQAEAGEGPGAREIPTESQFTTTSGTFPAPGSRRVWRNSTASSAGTPSPVGAVALTDMRPTTTVQPSPI